MDYEQRDRFGFDSLAGGDAASVSVFFFVYLYVFYSFSGQRYH